MIVWQVTEMFVTAAAEYGFFKGMHCVLRVEIMWRSHMYLTRLDLPGIGSFRWVVKRLELGSALACGAFPDSA